MRCQSCNKFAAPNFDEPEVNNLDMDLDGTVTYDVRLVLTSECCGDEMKSYNFDGSEPLPEEIIKKHTGVIEGTEDEHELECTEGDAEGTEEMVKRKHYYGFNLNYTVRCSCQKDSDPDLFEGSFDDKIASSAMEESY